MWTWAMSIPYDQGIVHYSLLTGKRTIYNKKNSGLESDIIVSSLSAKDGTLWFGTYEGGLASIKEGHVQTFKMHDGSDGLANNSVWAIDEDSVGHIWIGTLGGGHAQYGEFCIAQQLHILCPADP